MYVPPLLNETGQLFEWTHLHKMDCICESVLWSALRIIMYLNDVPNTMHNTINQVFFVCSMLTKVLHLCHEYHYIFCVKFYVKHNLILWKFCVIEIWSFMCSNGDFRSNQQITTQWNLSLNGYLLSQCLFTTLMAGLVYHKVDHFREMATMTNPTCIHKIQIQSVYIIVYTQPEKIMLRTLSLYYFISYFLHHQKSFHI